VKKGDFFSRKSSISLKRCDIHRVSKNVPPLRCYNCETWEQILICFGRNVTDKASNQKTLLRHLK